MAVGFIQQEFDREKLKLNVVRLKKGGDQYEILLDDPDAALRFRQGDSSVDVERTLKSETIFKDAKKGLAAPESEFKQVFGTDKMVEIAKMIIKQGEFHLTADQKRLLVDKKRKVIIDHIHMNAVDPKTNLPHPKQRIELAMDEAKVHIDIHNTAIAQIDDVIKKIQIILPLSFKRMHIRVLVPARYAAKVYSTLKGKHKVFAEQWLNDGSVQFELQTAAGLKPEILNLINTLSHGEASTEDVK